MSFLKIILIFTFLFSMPIAGLDYAVRDSLEFADAEKAAHTLNDLEPTKLQLKKRQVSKLLALPFCGHPNLEQLCFYSIQFETTFLDFTQSDIGYLHARAPPVV